MISDRFAYPSRFKIYGQVSRTGTSIPCDDMEHWMYIFPSEGAAELSQKTLLETANLFVDFVQFQILPDEL